jgi:hypothetical protein
VRIHHTSEADHAITCPSFLESYDCLDEITFAEHFSLLATSTSTFLSTTETPPSKAEASSFTLPTRLLSRAPISVRILPLLLLLLPLVLVPDLDLVVVLGLAAVQGRGLVLAADLGLATDLGLALEQVPALGVVRGLGLVLEVVLVAEVALVVEVDLVQDLVQEAAVGTALAMAPAQALVQVQVLALAAGQALVQVQALATDLAADLAADLVHLRLLRRAAQHKMAKAQQSPRQSP